MIVKRVELSNFRNYKLLKLDLDKKNEYFIWEKCSGKD